MLQAREPSARYLEAVQPALVRRIELLATAPSGVARLRELVLSLAVQGKLVPQDPRDETASSLLQRIHEEKAGLVAAGKIKRDKVSPTVAVDEAPFELPDTWLWTRLGAVAKKITDGTHHSPANFAAGDFKYLSAKNIKSLGIDLTDVTYVPASVHREIYSRCDPEPGDILYIKDGATTGVLTINTLREQFSLLSSVGVVKPSCGVSSEYLALLMRSPFFYQAMRDGMTGVAITRVTLSKLGAALVPLPPLAEQARIVARVDELMRLCDALEAQGRLEAAQHARLLGTLLGTLTDSSTPEELAANWQRVADHFDLLLDRPEAVDALEQTILQLAVRGLLIPLDASHEPADRWVGRMNTNRAHRRTAAATPTLADTNRPGLPAGWCVTNVGSVAECLDYIRRPIKKADREASCWSVPYYGANGQVGWIDEHLFDEDLVLVVEDETFIGRTKPFSYVVRGKSWVNNHAHVLRPLGGLSANFLNLCLERYDFIPLTSGTTNRRKLTQPGLLNAEFMIGPLEEQARILARVTELRRLCVDLRQRLTASQTTQSQLAAAMVNEMA